ncbi:U1 snRNP-associated [Pyrenophora seminiperda CCB06]|uniref:U1 snRNP-associated n=1 Tax=Pyrenophora seminiperda CCB06 TaxID=1302712 RepID=A0A3M7MGB1_9PLEO|nr:U1 snRNP-associated [Pyrenophora seminiperda CCB06]
MYGYPGAPGYNRPPGYAGAPPGMAPPGMGPPGAAPPPGVAGPPGVANAQGPPVMTGPRALPSGWQAPANMPNFNFNAPVIRLGTQGGRSGAADSPAGGRRDNGAPPARRGLGMDRDGDRRDGPMQVNPPSREEIFRTVFVGSIPDGVNDEAMERILETAGKLTRWTRATDASNKPQTFGFAEFGDAQSLERATEIFKDVRVPTKRQKPGKTKKEEGEEEEEVETTKLQFVVDDASIKYAESWTKNQDEATVQFHLDSAKEALSSVLASLFNPPNVAATDYAGDTMMQDAQAQDGEDVEVAFVNLANGEDELADIPEEMRETVAAEIAAFRDRSNQRDRERLRKEEELEQEERRRSGRRTPPPPSAPTGPGGVNGVPLGPRAERGVQGAPSGPKGSQFPRDYQGGVSFVNGGAVHNGTYITREDDDDSASDSELERRRQKKRNEEADEAYRKQLSRWLNTERRTLASLERTTETIKNKDKTYQENRAEQERRHREFDDDEEAALRRDPYYRDHGDWLRNREKVRGQEAKDDAADRELERRELAEEKKEQDHARGQADAFLEEQGEEIMRKEEQREPAAHFKISLGAATKKLEQTAAPRRTAADVENLLEDEDLTEQPGTKKRTLVPINFDAAVRSNLTQEEILEGQRQLARDIPTDKEGLWKWPISWDHLSEKTIDKDIKDWAGNRVFDIMGIQEEMVVDVIVDYLKDRRGPQALVENLEGALDEEAEKLVKKLWRIVIYYSETEKRGIK